MNRSSTRRDLLAHTGALLGAVGLAAQAPAQTTPATEDDYEKLGVKKIINAAGTYTILTAAVMPPSLQAEVAQAAKHPVRLLELQNKAGEYVAKRPPCDAAMVT